MTTVAWDGKQMAADTLATDYWGLKESVTNKVLEGRDFLLGCAGEHGQIMRWWKETAHKLTAEELIAQGYEPFRKDDNDPAMVLVCVHGTFRHVAGIFAQTARPYHAVGSGRDYALMAMRLGKSAAEAVELVMEFDNGTGGEVRTYDPVWSPIGGKQDD